jgi:acyl-CoA reductase-like NAD-dependent aldehyde dehydrogenase
VKGAASTGSDHQRVPNKVGDGDAAAARRGRSDHRRQHAHRERRVEGVSRASVRQRGDSQGGGRHAALAWAFGVLAREAGVPDGVYTRCTGSARKRVRRSSSIRCRGISFTGSCEVGRWIAETAGRRLRKSVSSLAARIRSIVCDDADLQNAVTWTLGSAFSNAGQRCARGSRIIVFDASTTVQGLAGGAPKKLKVGTGDTDDYGPSSTKSR